MIKIGGLQKLTLIDFPGCLAATVFLSGCNFRCPFCYSSELVLPAKVKLQPEISQESFFTFLKKRKDLLEGIVICGGEPTINKTLPQFIGKIKKTGYLVKLDTNGSNPQMLESLIKNQLVDYVAMDIKAPKAKYQEITGLGRAWSKRKLNSIEKSINLLKSLNVDFEFRTTVVPNLLDKEDILEIARWIKPAPRYFLQNFRPEKTIDSTFEKIKSYPQAYLLEIQKAVSPFFETCQVR